MCVCGGVLYRSTTPSCLSTSWFLCSRRTGRTLDPCTSSPPWDPLSTSTKHPTNFCPWLLCACGTFFSPNLTHPCVPVYLASYFPNDLLPRSRPAPTLAQNRVRGRSSFLDVAVCVFSFSSLAFVTHTISNTSPLPPACANPSWKNNCLFPRRQASSSSNKNNNIIIHPLSLPPSPYCWFSLSPRNNKWISLTNLPVFSECHMLFIHFPKGLPLPGLAAGVTSQSCRVSLPAYDSCKRGS